jgi:hypothetical protein
VHLERILLRSGSLDDAAFNGLKQLEGAGDAVSCNVVLSAIIHTIAGQQELTGTMLVASFSLRQFVVDWHFLRQSPASPSKAHTGAAATSGRNIDMHHW